MASDDTKALHWSCSTPVTCGESFFLIGQMIQLTRELLELRFRLRTACRVGFARMRAALMRYSWIRCDVSSALLIG